MILSQQLTEIAKVTQELISRPPKERLLLLRVFVGMVSTLSSELGDSEDISFARFLREQLTSANQGDRSNAFRHIILAMLGRTRYGSMTFSKEEIASKTDGKVEMAIPEGNEDFVVVYDPDFIAGRVQ